MDKCPSKWKALAFPASLFLVDLPWVEVQGDVPALQQGWMTQRFIYQKGERSQETPNWVLSLFDRRYTCWQSGMDLVSSWLKAQILLPLLFTERTRSTGAVCCPLQLLAEKWILPPASWCALRRVQAAQLHQPASERGLLNLSFQVAWCWRRGEQSLTAPRRWDAFGTQEGPLWQLEGCLVSCSTPSTRRMEKVGARRWMAHKALCLQACLDHVHTFAYALVQPIPTVHRALIAPCSQGHVLGTCTAHPTVLSLCEGWSIKQKLDVSCGLKCVLKISFWGFNSPTLFLVFCQTLFSCCFCTSVSTYTQRRWISSFSCQGCNQLHPGKCWVTQKCCPRVHGVWWMGTAGSEVLIRWQLLENEDTHLDTWDVGTVEEVW